MIEILLLVGIVAGSFRAGYLWRDAKAVVEETQRMKDSWRAHDEGYWGHAE